MIPLNVTAIVAMEAHASWYIRRFGECKPDWYVFPAGKGQPTPLKGSVSGCAAVALCLAVCQFLVARRTGGEAAAGPLPLRRRRAYRLPSRGRPASGS